MDYKRWMVALLAVVMVFGLVAVPGCASDEPAVEEPAAEEPAAEEPAFDARAAMIDAANEYFKSSPTPTIAAADLFNLVQAQDPGYQIVDIRSAEHYALGHIEGAINIPYKTIADDASLEQLDPAKKIVVVCYTGHTASMTNMVWNMLGYDALTLKFGMSGWVADKAVVGLDIPGKVGAGYPTVTDPVEAAGGFDAPDLAGDYAEVAEAIKAQTKAYFAKDLAPTISVEDVYNLVQAQDTTYQIVSVRKAEDYAKGHVAGAINILWTDIADNVDKIDPDKKVIIYCYTGHTGGEAAMFLNLMGYETYNMKFGMSGWNTDPAVGGAAGYDPAAVPNYATVK
jgi:rhodanese-related sulfurtransferase